MVEDDLGRLRLPVIGGEHQEAVALVVAQVGRQPLPEQLGQLVGVPHPGELEDAAGEGEGLVVQSRRGRRGAEGARTAVGIGIHAGRSPSPGVRGRMLMPRAAYRFQRPAPG